MCVCASVRLCVCVCVCVTTLCSRGALLCPFSAHPFVAAHLSPAPPEKRNPNASAVGESRLRCRCCGVECGRLGVSVYRIALFFPPFFFALQSRSPAVTRLLPHGHAKGRTDCTCATDGSFCTRRWVGLSNAWWQHHAAVLVPCLTLGRLCVQVEHPAAKLLVMASEQQAHEVGDGTNFVIIFAGMLLSKAEGLLNMVGAHHLNPKKILNDLAHCNHRVWPWHVMLSRCPLSPPPRGPPLVCLARLWE